MNRCNDDGDRSGCLGEADERYTMDFSDVEPGAKVYWCAFCGPEATAMNEALMEFLEESPINVAKFLVTLDEVKKDL